MNSRRITLIVTLLTVMALTLGACAKGSGDGSTYKIGFNSSATGSYASLGLPEAKFAQNLDRPREALAVTVRPISTMPPLEEWLQAI